MIIAVANSKGGVGKWTVSVHLAAWLHDRGFRVTLADCDMQHSSAQWVKEAAPGVKTVSFDDPNAILNELPGLDAECDFCHRRRAGQPVGNQPGTVAARSPGDRALQGEHS